MKKLSVTFFALLAPLLWKGEGRAFSQNRNNVWCFGDSAGINFNTQPPTPISSATRGPRSCTTVCDSLGNLLFSVRSQIDVGTYPYVGLVYDRNQQLMLSGDSILNEGGTKDLMIIPSPAQSNLYYVLSNDIVSNLGFYYSIVDMNQNGGLGTVVQKNILINPSDYIDAIAAVRHANGRDWWLLMHDWDINVGGNNFYIYLITPSGISTPSIQSIGSLYKTDLADIRFSPDGSRLVGTNYNGLIELFDFDRCTGLLSNPNLISSANGSVQKIFVGCAFSPNNNVLYVSVTDNIFGGDSLRLYQFNLLAANIANSKTTIYNAVVPASGGLQQLGPDGKIYWSCLYSYGYPYADSVRNVYNENLSVINNPDVVGLGCNFQPFSFYLGGKRTYWGLPNNANYDLGAVSGSVCDSLGLAVEEIQPHPQNIFIYYHPQWQTAFINVQGLKGKTYTM